jgi:hypothetical protein
MGIDKRTKARKARNGDERMEKGRRGNLMLDMGMLQAVCLGLQILGLAAEGTLGKKEQRVTLSLSFRGIPCCCGIGLF